MTDEELAEEWIKNNLHSTEEDYKQAFLAGLKTGRPQCHDLRKNPNDLPERDKTFVTDVSVTVIVYPLGFAMYYFFDKKWYSNGKEVKVDMWCEIPTFDKE